MGYDKTHGTKKESQSQLDVESGKETEMENKAMAKVSGGHPKGGFMQTPLRYGTHEGRGTTKKGLYSPPKTLSEKQSKVIDGADGSKKNDEIEGSEMAALSKK